MATSTPAKLSRSYAALYAGVIGAPVVWGLHLEVGYALAPKLCRMGSHLPLHAITAIGVLLALAGAYISYRDWRAASATAPPPGQKEDLTVARAKFVGSLGAVCGLTFAMTILAQGLAAFFFDGCWV